MIRSRPNLADALSRRALLHPDAIAVRLPRARLSYRQLEGLVWRFAEFLRDSGAGPGDIVALGFESELAQLVAMLATARIGATAFTLPSRLPAPLRAELTGMIDIALLLTDSHAATVEPGLRRLRVDLRVLAESSAPIDTRVRDPSPNAPWLIVTGSGSTGRPKLLALTHAQARAQAELTARSISISPTDRVMSLVHLDLSSTKDRFLAALLRGASVVLFERRGADVFAVCRRAQASVMWATAFHLEQMLRALPADSTEALPSLRVLLAGTATVSMSLRRRALSMLTPNLYVRYGANECGLMSIAGPDDLLASADTVGRVPQGVSLEVVDAAGRPLPAGEIGLVRVRSRGVVGGYLNDDDATRRMFGEHGFLPGDLACFTADGQLVHCGRADHMMIMDGVNVYPAEIERVLSAHPAVRDVAAVPLRSAVHQDIPVCAVALLEGSRVTGDELREHAFLHLGVRGPRKVVVLDRIPRDEIGKLDRANLAAAIASAMGLETADPADDERG